MNKKVIQIVLTVVICACLPVIYMKIAEKQAAATMSNIERSVANDAVKQYEMAARHGDEIEMYTHAGMCAQAFLQIGDEANYRKWKNIEGQLATKIGLPQ